MSLEESMSTLAESNNRLAAALDKYAGVIEGLASANGVAFAGGTPVASGNSDAGSDAGSEGATGTTKRKRRTAAEIAADAKAEADKLAGKTADGDGSNEPDPFGDDADPFGDAEPEKPALTADSIRALVLKVRDKDKALATGLLKKLGVDTLAKIEPAQYEKVVELAGKVGVTL